MISASYNKATVWFVISGLAHMDIIRMNYRLENITYGVSCVGFRERRTKSVTLVAACFVFF